MKSSAPMTSISRLHVQGYKSLADVSVDLGQVNVFIGANGSGKSNLLEAIGLASAAAFGSVEPESLRYRGVRRGAPSLYKTAFKGARRIRRLITLDVFSDAAEYKVGLDNPISSPSPKWNVTSETLVDHDHQLLTRNPAGARVFDAKGVGTRLPVAKDQTAARLASAGRPDAVAAAELLAALDGFAIFTPYTPVLRRVLPDTVERSPLGLSGSGLAEAVASLVSSRSAKFGPFELDEVWELIEWADRVLALPTGPSQASAASTTVPRRSLYFHDRFMVDARSYLSASDASEGALYVLFLLALVGHSDAPRIVGVDNFDQALHPRLVKRLIELVLAQALEAARPQLLLSTHNPLVLDGLDLKDDRVRLFAVDRDELGATRVKRVRITIDLEREADAEGLSLSRLWLMGRLGGIPESL